MRYQRVCKRCGELFYTACRHGKICLKCVKFKGSCGVLEEDE